MGHRFAILFNGVIEKLKNILNFMEIVMLWKKHYELNENYENNWNSMPPISSDYQRLSRWTCWTEAAAEVRLLNETVQRDGRARLLNETGEQDCLMRRSNKTAKQDYWTRSSNKTVEQEGCSSFRIESASQQDALSTASNDSNGSNNSNNPKHSSRTHTLN